MTAILEAAAVDGLAAASPALGPTTPPITRHPAVRVEFVETAGATVTGYIATVEVPPGYGIAGHILHMVGFDADQTRVFGGDSGSATRFFNNLNFDIAPGAVATKIFDAGRDTYLGAGEDATDQNGDPYYPYYPDGDTLTYKVTTTGAGGTTGRLTVIVSFVALPTTAITAVKS